MDFEFGSYDLFDFFVVKWFYLILKVCEGFDVWVGKKIWLVGEYLVEFYVGGVYCFEVVDELFGFFSGCSCCCVVFWSVYVYVEGFVGCYLFDEI